MKCKTIITAIRNWAKDSNNVENEITAWLQTNLEVKVISFAQVSLGSGTIITTILYE
nr:hypothetical protein [Candidatus Sigynarchaeota archaeon]